jgi:hypothetical protein
MSAVDGARNLLLGCAGAQPGESLLIVEEDPALGYYGPGLAAAVAATAEGLSITTTTRRVGFSPSVGPLPDDLAAAMQAADHTLFLARLGDQLRYTDMPAGTRPIISYALDLEMLASPLGTAPAPVFEAMKALINGFLASAAEITVTCPLGTRMTGRVRPGAASNNTTVKRFPTTVFAPLDAIGFAGRIVVAHFLVGTGSNFYQPYGIPLETPLIAHIADGRLRHWEGPEAAGAEAHYTHVAGLFDIDAHAIHSWHAGIHPGCAYPMPAHQNYERWSGGAFGNPRLLHFHTCGAYAPGEICWNLIDATLVADGVTLYEAGRLHLARIPGGAALLAAHPAIARLFDHPAQAIGI